jgi:hypothetical protein
MELDFPEARLLQPVLNVIMGIDTAVCQQKIVWGNQPNDSIGHIAQHFARNLIQNSNLSPWFERGRTTA